MRSPTRHANTAASARKTTMVTDIFVASSFVAWLGPERLEPGRRATELVAVDAGGQEVAAFVEIGLDGRSFTPLVRQSCASDACNQWTSGDAHGLPSREYGD
jgi:hypothetical protein